jgi:BioD-like phosphotransacetylase family protein
MKTLYITSVERYAGKTATCLALGKRFQKDGFQVGYLKPLSLQPWRVENKIADEDAAFVIETLGLKAKPWELSPIVVNSEFLQSLLEGKFEDHLMERVLEAIDSISRGLDILILEGGGSLCEGHVVDLPVPKVAKALKSAVIALVNYREEVSVLDDALAAQNQLGAELRGVIINRVPEPSKPFVKDLVRPFLEDRAIPILGVLPEVKSLAAITVGELIEVLKAKVLVKHYSEEALVENLTVGAMTAEAALSRFRKQTNKAVITGGDRTDIQLAALETSTTCLVLTGNLKPSPLIVKQAEELEVPILLVRPNTLETIEIIEDVFGKTRLGQPIKLKKFRTLLSQNIDWDRLYKTLDLDQSSGA